VVEYRGLVAEGRFDIESGYRAPVAEGFSPELTATELPKRELGATAAGILFDRLARPRRGARTARLTGTIRVRESCGCALRGKSNIGRER
jgi:DNA-binding LacI/PurR family transcriptional regulator